MSNAMVFLRRMARGMWFRAAIYTVAAVALALAAGVVGAWVPFPLSINLGQNSVGSLLEIIASSMLAVTTFSLATMVTAYSSATTNATPRATQLLVHDRASQGALSTFIGGFSFSLVGIIALSTGYYTEQGRVILFLGTLVMIALIVVTLLRWIAHLATFGRMADVIDRVEKAASKALQAYAASPTLGARRLETVPDSAVPVWPEHPGYITHVDVGALERIAQRRSVDIYAIATPGRVADATTPLARIVGECDDDLRDAVRGAFRVDAHRDYEQDPRLGVIALAEIGSRALSPATNDPGTAIEVLGALQRVFTSILTADRDDERRYDRVWVRPVSLTDLLTDGFRPLARDGAGMLEVQIRLQKTLADLAVVSPGHRSLFRDAADKALERSTAALARPDTRVLRRTYRQLWR